MSNRVDDKFAALRARGRTAFMPFLPAGDPDLDTTRALILELERRGADLVELGIPFSDPVADGPTIQASFTRALDRGVHVMNIFDMIRDVRRESSIPIVTMVSYSIVHRMGPERFVTEAAAAGADGAIVPDLPLEEADDFVEFARRKDFCTVFLVAPTTPTARQRKIVTRCTGFVYYVSVAGTTGARDTLPPDLRDYIAELRRTGDLPVAVGFGVSTPQQAANVAAVADGVIVGSAIVKRIAEHADSEQSVLLREVGAFAASLAEAAHGAGGEAAHDGGSKR